MIFSTRWLADREFSIFAKNSKLWEKHDQSDVVFNYITARTELGSVRDKTKMNQLFGILEEDENSTNKLILIAKDLIENNYGKVKLLQSDIEKKSWKYLSTDIFSALDNHRTDAGLINILSKYVANRWTPSCYYKEEGVYQAYGINHLPKGCIPEPEWSKALVTDFSNEGDEVVLVLHGQTDWWKDLKGFGYMPEESQDMSKELERAISINLFFHDDSNDVAKALKMNKEKLSNIWNYLHNNEKKYTR